MIQIKINKNTFLLCDKYEKGKIRLIVNQDKVELACRKEKIAILTSFLEKKNGQIFKGRLQLQVDDDQLQILVKKEVVGIIDKQLLLREINT